jgi:hypothetical protein
MLDAVALRIRPTLNQVLFADLLFVIAATIFNIRHLSFSVARWSETIWRVSC